MNTFVLNQNQTYLRYELYLPRHEQPKLNQAKSYLSHNQFCPWTQGIVVHTTCKTLLNHPERYGSFSMALHIASGQQARLVKSKQSLASFKMMQNQALGCCACLRKLTRLHFSYKWAFLAPGQADATSKKAFTAASSLVPNTRLNAGVPQADLGLNNVFVFELDHLDYGLFEFMHGLDLSYLPSRANDSHWV